MQNRFLKLAILMVAAFALSACVDEPVPQDDAAAALQEDSAPQLMEAGTAQATKALIAAAVADTARPQEDLARDTDRKPSDIMAFAGFKPGDVVADIGASGGYYTRILSTIVGGEGHVYAFNSKEVADMFYADANPSDVVAMEYENVTSVVGPLSTPRFDKPLDGALIVKFYHDSHWENLATNTATMNETIFDQLKPGGTYLIIDHAAQDGSGLRDVGTMHRIDGALVKQEAIAAGFELLAESDLLANPQDDRTKAVFDPSVRGKTDRFVYIFRKPA
ncbi:SAM-dependent methyltransferase [Gammaproteobacteria bacterium]|nr:SAM-dependent methyltransferase [Gammaproteobacteria bacterium]